MAYTLTYSEAAKGWPSFYSFEPEMMIGMNNYFYSFKGGKLYRHNTGSTRNNFYGQQYSSRITGVINEDPSTVKTFKTISLESTAPWDCTLTSDLGSGYIDSAWFTLKEGDYYGHIRRNDNDGVLEMRSLQGIGSSTDVDSTDASAVVITFPFKLDSMISVGDKMYRQSAGSLALVGDIVSKNKKTLTVDTSIIGGSIPSTGTFLAYIKNNVAESYGTTGYYMQYEIENHDTTFVEIYGIGSSLFKSYP
ncbi:MAG: hypothetical protein ACO393_06155 [Methylophilaceae bacterium]